MSDSLKVLIAYYAPREQRFIIPCGLDLEDTTKVDVYWIKREVLYIEFVYGLFKHIRSYYDFEDDNGPV